MRFQNLIMEFSDIAAVSGKGTLFNIVQPTRTGVILETLDEHKKKMVATMHNKGKHSVRDFDLYHGC